MSRPSMMWISAPALFAIALLSPPAPGQEKAQKPKAAAPPAAGVEHWQGILKAGPREIPLVLNVKRDDKGAVRSATMDSPDEGAEGLALDPFAIADGKLSFGLKVSSARYEGKLNKAGDEAVGSWSQRGAKLPLTFKKTKTPMAVPKFVGPEQLWEGKLELGAG